MKSCLSYLDLVGDEIAIKYKNKRSHGHWMGGIVTLIIVFLSLGVSAYFFVVQLVKRENPKASLVSKFVDNPGRINFDPKGMLHYIHLFNQFTGRQIKFDKKALNVTGMVYNAVVKGEYIYDFCNYELDFKGREDIFLDSKKAEIEDSFCPRIYINPNGNRIEKKYFDDKDFVYPYTELASIINANMTVYQLRISRCVNSTSNHNTCYSNDKINEYYNGNYFSLKFVDNYFDVTDYNKPVVPYINVINGVLNMKTLSQNWFNFIKVKVSTLDGLIFDSPQEVESYKFDYRVELATEKNEDSDILTIIFDLQNTYQFYNRSYPKLQDLCANIGGIINLLLIIGKLINNLFSKFQRLINSHDFFLKRKVLLNNNNDNNDSVKERSSNNLLHIRRNEYQISTAPKVGPDLNNSNAVVIADTNSKMLKMGKETTTNKEKYTDKLYCWQYYCCKRNSSTSQQLDQVRECIDILLDENNLYNSYIELLRLKKFILKTEENKKDYKAIPMMVEDILLSDVHKEKRIWSSDINLNNISEMA